MNILVTGGTGFIGQSFVKSISHEHQVFCIVRDNSIYEALLKNSNNITIINCKIDSLSNNEILGDIKIDIVFHFAWAGIRGEYRNNEEFQIENYKNAVRLFEFIAFKKITKVVMLGSQEEFSNVNYIDNKAVSNPITQYGKYKKKVHEYGLMLSKEIGFKFYWLRVFSIYGSGDFDGSLIKESLIKFKRNEVVSINYGMKMWDYLFIDDLIDLLNIVLCKHVKPGTYNVAYGESKYIYDYLSIMRKLLNSNSEIEILNKDLVNGLVVNIEETKKSFNWSPKYDFKAGLDKMLTELFENS